MTESAPATTEKNLLPTPDPRFEWDPYLLYENLSSDAELYASARIFIDAVLGYKESAVIANPDHRSAICENIFFNFPLAAIVDYRNDEQSGSIKIEYHFSKEEHESKVKAFAARVEEILSLCVREEYNDIQNALELYRYVAINVNYFSVDYTEKQISAYSALMHDTTVCYGYADAFNYLLRQIGIKAWLLEGRVSYTDKDDEHGWSLVLLEGEYYHCDPTWEHSSTKGSGLHWFGMSDARRFAARTVSYEKGVYIGKGELALRYEKGRADSGFFDFCNGSKSWYFDGEYLVVN